MGVPGLWTVLQPAGKPRSLTHLSVKDGFEANPDGKRGFRVGIDASIWFYHATYGREGENPELRTLFFRCTRLMSMPFLPLFVFDGPKRPEIKRGKRISGKNHWMVQGMQEIISAFGFEWRMAPGEAEAELAYLNRIRVIDAVLSDDVDTFLFGAKMVVRNPSATLSGNRSQPLKNSAGKDDGNHVMTYTSADLLSHEDIKLTQGGLILIGVLRGGDYSDGLQNCGVATAHGLAKAGFGDTLLHAARTMSRDELEEFLVEWRQELRDELRTNPRGRLQRKSPALAKAIPEDFPDIDVLLAYTNPVTSEAKGPGHKNVNVDWDKEPDLGRIAGLCEMYFEWGLKPIIIKRFRNVLWPSAVLRILRRAALIKDMKAAATLLGARSPETPRKNGKERRAPPGTPSSMITKHFARFTINTPRRSADSDDDEEEDGERLIVKIHSSRRHPSTDNVLEYRLEIAPAQLVRLSEAGIKGLRTSLPPDLSDSDDDGDDDDDDEGGKKKGTKKTKKPPADPESHLRIWLPASMVKLVEPELVEEFEGLQRKKKEKKAGKGAKGKDASGTARTSKKAQALPAIPQEEESASDSDTPPAMRRTKENLSPAAKTSQSKGTVGGGKRPPITSSSKISNIFVAKKPSTSTVSKSSRTTSSTAKVADLFRGASLAEGTRRSEEEESTDDEAPPLLPRLFAAAGVTSTVSAKAASPSKSSSSRLLTFLENSASAIVDSSQASASPSSSRTRALRPFPMDFDLTKDDQHCPRSPEEEDLFATEGRTSSSSSRTRVRAARGHDSLPTEQQLHKSPRRARQQASPRSTPPKLHTSHKEEEEASSDDDNSSRAPSPSPLKGRYPTTLGNSSPTSRIRQSATTRTKEKGVDPAPSLPPSPTRRKPLAAVSSKPVSRPTAAIRRPAPLPTDLSIISISSDSESEPPPKPAKVTPLQLAKKRSESAKAKLPTIKSAQPPSGGKQKPRRIYDEDDIIDLT